MTDKPPTTPRPPPGYSVNDDAALARALQMNEYQPALSNPVNTNPSVTPAAAETGAQPGYAGAAQAPPPQGYGPYGWENPAPYGVDLHRLQMADQALFREYMELMSSAVLVRLLAMIEIFFSLIWLFSGYIAGLGVFFAPAGFIGAPKLSAPLTAVYALWETASLGLTIWGASVTDGGWTGFTVFSVLIQVLIAGYIWNFVSKCPKDGNKRFADAANSIPAPQIMIVPHGAAPPPGAVPYGYGGPQGGFYGGGAAGGGQGGGQGGTLVANPEAH